MARSDEEICNVGLQRVGVTLSIDSLGQRVKEAIVCNLIYATTRERVLTAAPWPFARKYQLLNLSGVAPLKWKYSYVYPNDCLAIRRIFPNLGAGFDPFTLRRIGREFKIPYEIVTGESGEKMICTDLQDAGIEYTMNVTNPMRFDAAFASAFAWAIAGEVAVPLSRDAKYMNNALAMYDREIGIAMAKALNEEGQDEDPESEFVRARF